MAGLLDRSEGLLEGIFEGVPMQLSGARVQPAQIAKRLELAMDTEKMVGADGVIFAPHLYQVALNPCDYKSYARNPSYWAERMTSRKK